MTTLRQLLQSSLNEEIDQILQNYVKTYIQPAIEALEENQQLGIIEKNGLPPSQYIKIICRELLDEAKKMY